MGLDIYIGAEVEYESERILLTEIDRVWSLDPRPTIVLANINLGDRQIDAVAIRDGLVLVLEAKKFARPVRGTVNGWWQVQLASGAWRECPNAWTQVLGEKNALRDAMRDFDRTVSGFYPQASVVFMPDIPPGSQLPAGDYKASVIGGSGFAVRLGEVHGNCWDFVRWREFAAHHGLRKVASLASAISADLLTAETRLAEYADHYSRTYAAEADEFIDSPCLVENEQDSSKAVIERIVDGQSNILVNGSSGCGKTLLAKKVGVSALQSGVIPFHVRANEFEGSIKSLLEREAGLLSSASAAAILGAVRRLDRRLLLIVDGYNECGAEMRAMLTRAIAALARRYAATVLVTSQIPLAHPELVTAKEVTVPPPSAELKREIASKAMGGHFRSPELDDLLVSVTTGLEAHLVGAVGLKAGAEASRFALFDAFVRMRLGSAARDGIRALSLLAGWLTDRYTFGISVRDMDRLSEENSVAPSVASLLLDRKLLVRRGDRLTFSHELFLNALAAESVVRRSGGDAQRIAFAIDSPVHADSATLIVGAIDDHGLLVRVLGQMSSAGLLAACKSGACGKAALEWVNARIPSLFEKMREELRHVQFRIDTSAWSSVAIDINADGFWTSGERALIACIPDLMATGTLLDEVLGVIEDMDGLIARERERLKDAARVEKIGLRTAMFASAYVVQRPDAPAIAQVCSRLHGGLFRRATSAALMRRMRQAVSQGVATPGQMSVLVTLSRSVDPDSVLAADFIRWGLINHWVTAPYHLRLALADAAGYRRDAPDTQKAGLVSALEALLSNDEPLLNTPIFESLQSLGASEAMEAEHIGSVRDHLAQVLESPDDESAWEEARGLYNCQFDHPYSNAYWEAIHELPQDKYNQFLLMAGRGARDSFFLGLLLRDLCEIGGPVACEILGRWTELPPRNAVAPQESVEIFVVAHESIGRLQGALPLLAGSGSEDAAAEALRACGVALYWANRIDLSVEARRAESVKAWNALATGSKAAALVAIHMCTEWHMLVRTRPPAPGDPETLPQYFAEESSSVCRRALEYPRDQIGYFNHFRESDRQSALIFAFDVLQEHGNSADLMLLRQWSGDPDLGRFAIRAIGKLEARVVAAGA